MPYVTALAIAATAAGYRENERSPIMALCPQSKSSTGANVKSTPQARSSAAITNPAAVNARVAA